MPSPSPSAHVRLALHPGHGTAVTATITGSPLYLARAALAIHGFRSTSDTTMVLARIDHEAPHYAGKAAQALREDGTTVDIDPALQEEIDTEWTYGNYPMTWLDREEIREVSAEAQRIHDDIAAGRLVIHMHAHDGWTTVAVGTYQDGRSIHLHGEDYLRQETWFFDSEAEAVARFLSSHPVAARPGPAPPTDIERAAAEALASFPVGVPAPAAPLVQAGAPAEPVSQSVPAYAADPGDHEALLRDFFTKHQEWEKWRPHDETTIASHESLTLRVEFLHEALRGDDAWTIAAYESPVGERLWHATATPTTPVEIMRTLLDSLNTDNAWSPSTNSPVTEEHLAQASRPLEDVGWPLKVGSRLIDWTAPTPGHGAGLRFDTSVKQASVLPAWTVWGGNTADSPHWAIHLSTHAPTALIQDVAFELAHGQGLRQPQLRAATTASHLATKAAVARPPASAPRPAPRR
ncbi:DUF317 domain-containing protein [Streptomyces sp. H27-H1]|uniref:DUF317 domain-containing protein n=1 Tax=Streptomyces sp. H27-H1 TaxID=2996461 RepID=UPI0022714952|nr:DUF317 domain-containing protein [Streptomyces sp. H27-H1]MCY0928194.1 DUF317 domain-containing protein [Streptomyces sp. H27-H1]